MRVLAGLLLLLVVPVAQAQMYKCTEGGKTRYSDKPIADCRNAEVKGQVNVHAGTPTPPRAGRVPKEVVEADRKCIQLRQENQRLRRAPDSASRDERMQEMRSALAACS